MNVMMVHTSAIAIILAIRLSTSRKHKKVTLSWEVEWLLLFMCLLV